MALYHASCACVCAHACSGECQPGSVLPRATYLAICVATTRPIFPFLKDGKDTVALPLSVLSVKRCSFVFISSTVFLRSRFHSMAFLLRSRCTSIIYID